MQRTTYGRMKGRSANGTRFTPREPKVQAVTVYLPTADLVELERRGESVTVAVAAGLRMFLLGAVKPACVPTVALEGGATSEGGYQPSVTDKQISKSQLRIAATGDAA